jgi:Mn2+/Fe2+ NRAMP family transporter
MHYLSLNGLAAVSATPNPNALPGSNVLQQLVNGAEAWALAIALLGAFIGAALWAIASHTTITTTPREAGWRHWSRPPQR